MTAIFSFLTLLALLGAAIFAHVTGMSATSYFVLMFALGAYLLWCGRKHYALATIKQDD